MISETISSAKNPKVVMWKSLKERKGRTENNCFIVEGSKMVEEALSAIDSFCVKELIVSERSSDTYSGIIQAALEINISVCSVTDNVMNTVCDTKTPQGIAAVVNLPCSRTMAGKYRFVAALDGVQDPGNVGTIIRTADAAGFDGVIMSRTCADPFSPKVLRATMGSIFRINPIVCDNLPSSLRKLKESGCSIISSQLDGEPFYKRNPVTEPVCLVIGNEGNGVSEEVKQLATHKFKLPMRGGAESLNASVAAGIMMYDLTKDI